MAEIRSPIFKAGIIARMPAPSKLPVPQVVREAGDGRDE
jgi:hypothetical protein